MAAQWNVRYSYVGFFHHQNSTIMQNLNASPAQTINERLPIHSYILKTIKAGKPFRLMRDRRPYRYQFVKEAALSYGLYRDNVRFASCQEHSFYTNGFVATVDLFGEFHQHSVTVFDIRIIKDAEGSDLC